MIDVQLEIFLLTAVGFLLGRHGVLDNHARERLIDVLFIVVLPASVIESFEMEITSSVLMQTLTVLLVSCGTQAFYWCWNHVFYRSAEEGRRACLRYATMVSNAGLIGMPLAGAYFGPEGLLLSAVFLIPQRVFMWSYGLSMFADSKGWEAIRRVATHPCVVSTIAGFGVMVLYSAGFTFPPFLESAIAELGGCSTALGMIVVGGILSDCRLSSVFGGDVLVYCLYRLLIIPFCILGLLWLLSVDGLSAQVAVLLTGMPAAATTAMLAEKYGRDALFASRLVLSSTLLSLITVPVVFLAASAAF